MDDMRVNPFENYVKLYQVVPNYEEMRLASLAPRVTPDTP
jgi:hypothetical protein